MGANFKNPLRNLPITLKYLRLSKYATNNDIDHLPPITHLMFSYNFNSLVNNLPKSLTHLILGARFDQAIDNLPHGLTHLKIGDDFNQNIDKLPSTIVYLSLGEEFNRKIEKLPASLEQLKFLPKFNKRINNFPVSLRRLFIREDYSYKKDIPKDIDIKKCEGDEDEIDLDSFSVDLQGFVLADDPDEFPF